MRWFAWCLMIVSAVFIGCEKPEETIPPITPTSGTTDSAEHDGEGHEHAEGEEHEHAEGEEHEHAEGEEHEHAEGEEHEHAEGEASESDEKPADEDSADVAAGETIRFVANKSISVPDMMCPYSCWPNVQKTLAGMPGVEGVQLAEQPEGTQEGEIKERVVELKVNDEFDTDAAIAALGKINFKSEVIN